MTVHVNPIADHLLGAALLFLTIRWVKFCYDSHSSTPLFTYVFALSLPATLFFIFFTKKIFGVAGRAFSATRTHKSIPPKDRDPLADEIVNAKWEDQSWQLVIHTLMTIWEYRLLSTTLGQLWWADPANAVSCPGTNPNAELEVLQIVQLSIWIVTGFSCKFFEERRKDYIEMMLHHCVTVYLISENFMTEQYPFAVLVLFIHDSSDIIIDLLKMSNYMKTEESHGFYFTEIMFFASTFCVWPYFRLYVYPRYIIYGFYITTTRCGEPTGTAGTIALSILVVLHVYWWCLFIRIFYRSIVKGEGSGGEIGDDDYEGVAFTQTKTEKKKKKIRTPAPAARITRSATKKKN